LQIWETTTTALIRFVETKSSVVRERLLVVRNVSSFSRGWWISFGWRWLTVFIGGLTYVRQLATA